jgi:hypothetical protein
MNFRKILVDLICLGLALDLFYEGISKVIYWYPYSVWLHHAPLLSPMAPVLSFLLPVFELGLALLLFLPAYRSRALYIMIAAYILFLAWVMGVYFFINPKFFYPYQTLIPNRTWQPKIFLTLGLTWVAFIAIIFSNETLHIRKILRKPPANAR